MAFSTADAAPADASRQVGAYRLAGLIGEGGMGRVYQAEEILTGRVVALKLMRHELTESVEARRLFVREMDLLSRLEDPHIVRSLACFEDDGQLAMAMERVHGSTLRAVLAERGPLAWWRAGHIVSQIAEALIAAHEHDPPIVHCDLKPENVMLQRDGSVKVMDFGIARAVVDHCPTRTRSAGSLQYMSPEQIDAKTVDHRSDLYALGLMTFELLAGEPPFASPSPRKLLEMQCAHPPPALPVHVREKIPPAMAELLAALLRKLPEERPSSAREVVAVLQPLLPSSEPESVPPCRPDAETGDAHDTLACAANVVTEMGQDTVVMIDSARGLAVWSRWRALCVIAMACTVSGLATYFIKTHLGEAARATLVGEP
jgi:serine/threonine-protein kinase